MGSGFPFSAFDYAFELIDRSAGVPAGTKAEAAVRARKAEQTPSQDGDITVLSTKLTL